MILRACFLALFLFLPFTAQAVSPDEMLADPALEARAREISKNLRCLVCQGEDIDHSEAALAADLRRLVRAQILKGASDEEVLIHIRDRYGDAVLMRPPVDGRTGVLWILPFLVMGGGVFIVWRLSANRQGRE